MEVGATRRLAQTMSQNGTTSDKINTILQTWEMGLREQEWAQLDSNTPSKPSEKPPVSNARAAKCAAETAITRLSSAPERPLAAAGAIAAAGAVRQQSDASARADGGVPAKLPARGNGRVQTHKARAAGPDSGERTFAKALAMLARLPLSDEERAEAVRRLMAKRGS